MRKEQLKKIKERMNKRKKDEMKKMEERKIKNKVKQ